MPNVLVPRVIFAGDTGVGKTALIYRMKHNSFNPNTLPTLGAGITEMDSTIDGSSLLYQLWDTAGQEIYRNIVPIYFRGAVCAVIVFSIEEPRSFQNIDGWIEQLLNNAEGNVGIVIVGNKIDSERPRVDMAAVENWTSQKNYPLIWTSAVTGQNVDILEDHIVTRYVVPVKEVEIPKGPIVNTGEGSCCRG
jgi:small GTP-binding protein